MTDIEESKIARDSDACAVRKDVVTASCDVRHVCLASIRVTRNPRKHFDAAELAELEASIRSIGIAQPILLRDLEDGSYELIAGERRVRAARNVFGDDGMVPALVRQCSEQEATVLALVENSVRADMAPTEEAEAAHALVVRVKGDREEAAALLGWPLGKLTRRLALMRLDPTVRDALTRREIPLGVAELLAAVPQAKQVVALEKIVAHKLTTAQVKAQVSQMAHDLSAAVFDRTECATCPHNSSTQAGLFGEVIEAGQCTSPSCFEGKTRAHLEGLRSELATSYPKVIVLHPDGPDMTVRLVAQGRGGVGETQASACRSCANFGASVSGVPGSLGVVSRDLCFDVACNQKMAAAFLRGEQDRARQAAAAQAESDAPSGARAVGGVGAGRSNAGKASDEATAQVARLGGGAAGATEAKAPAKPASVTNRVQEFRVAAWRRMAARECMAQPDRAERVLVALALTHGLSRVDSRKVAEVWRSLAPDTRQGVCKLPEWLAEIGAADGRVVQRAIHATAASCMAGLGEDELVAVLNALEVCEERHFTFNAEVAQLLTKSELEVAARDIGLDAALGAKAFGKALSGKRDELITALLSVPGFTYVGAVPAVFRYPRTLAQANTHGKAERPTSEPVPA